MSVAVLLLLLLLLLLRVVLNRQLRMAVSPAGPQPQVQDGSVPCRTSNREFRLAVLPAARKVEKTPNDMFEHV